MWTTWPWWWPPTVCGANPTIRASSSRTPARRCPSYECSSFTLTPVLLKGWFRPWSPVGGAEPDLSAAPVKHLHFFFCCCSDHTGNCWLDIRLLWKQLVLCCPMLCVFTDTFHPSTFTYFTVTGCMCRNTFLKPLSQTLIDITCHLSRAKTLPV